MKGLLAQDRNYLDNFVLFFCRLSITPPSRFLSSRFPCLILMNFGNQLSNSHAFEAHELLIRNSGVVVVVVVVEACFKYLSRKF